MLKKTKYYDLLAFRKLMIEEMKKFLIIASLLSSFSASAITDQTVYLPDGTQIIVRKNKAYYSPVLDLQALWNVLGTILRASSQ